jgi:hypothetical protein
MKYQNEKKVKALRISHYFKDKKLNIKSNSIQATPYTNMQYQYQDPITNPQNRQQINLSV